MDKKNEIFNAQKNKNVKKKAFCLLENWFENDLLITNNTQIIKNKPNSVVSLKKIVEPSWIFISLNRIFFSDSPGL